MTTSVTPVTVRDRAIRVLGGLPPFSPILNRVIASLAHEDVSFSEITGLIEKDTVLAGNILKLVNSALYGRRGTVTSVQQAISLMGVNRLRNATLSLSVARIWNQMKAPTGWSMASFNLHSASVAILSDLLARRLRVDFAEGAFAAGLFHDLGWLLVAFGCPEEFEQASRRFRQNDRWTLEDEIEILGTSHADLSAAALSVWNLPEPIQAAVRYHLMPEQDPAARHPGHVPLSRIVDVADQCMLGTGTSLTLFENNDENPTEAFQSIGLGERMEAILTEFATEFSAVKSYF